jgi:hypothetical protein
MMVERKSMISYRSKIKIQRRFLNKKKDLNLAKTHLEQRVLNSGFITNKWWMNRCCSSIGNFSQKYKYFYTSKIRIQRRFAKKKARFEVCENVFKGAVRVNSFSMVNRRYLLILKKNVKVVLLLCTNIYISRYTYQSIGLRNSSLRKDETLEGFTNNP